MEESNIKDSTTSAGKVGIVNYGAGNIFSLTAALERQSIAYGMVNTEADLGKYERIIIQELGMLVQPCANWNKPDWSMPSKL